MAVSHMLLVSVVTIAIVRSHDHDRDHDPNLKTQPGSGSQAINRAITFAIGAIFDF